MISKRNKNRREGFTLLEVIIALAVFGFVVTGLMAFLPWAIDGKANIKDFNTACAMPDAIQIELERLGFNAVEDATDPGGDGPALLGCLLSAIDPVVGDEGEEEGGVEKPRRRTPEAGPQPQLFLCVRPLRSSCS